MVTAGKVFKLREKTDLQTIASKLKGFHQEEQFEDGKSRIILQSEVKDLSRSDGILKGVFAQDIVVNLYHRGESSSAPKTQEIHFAFIDGKDRTSLLVLEKKQLANQVANRLGEVLFVEYGYVVEAKIPPDTLKSFHEENRENTKIIFFRDIDIPNVSKLSLYGSGLRDSDLYERYLSHGEIWYLVVTSKRYGYIAGITGNSVITVFNRVDKSEYVDFVIKEILPLTV